MTTRRLFLTFNQAAIDQPILSTLTSRFGLVFSIFGATVYDDVRFVALELEGDDDRLDEAVAYMRELGVEIEFRDD